MEQNLNTFKTKKRHLSSYLFLYGGFVLLFSLGFFVVVNNRSDFIVRTAMGIVSGVLYLLAGYMQKNEALFEVNFFRTLGLVLLVVSIAPFLH